MNKDFTVVGLYIECSNTRGHIDFYVCLFSAGFLSDIQRCLPRKVLITLGDPDYQQFPYFIEAYRCNGVCSTSFTPKEQQCVAVTWENITGNVFDRTTQSIKPITVQNHTSCNCQCVAKAEDCSENEQFDKDNCRCACKYTDEPPNPCPERFRFVRLFLTFWFYAYKEFS